MKLLNKIIIALTLTSTPGFAVDFETADLAAFQALINVRSEFAQLPLPNAEIDYLNYDVDNNLRAVFKICGFVGCAVDTELRIGIKQSGHGPADYTTEWVQPGSYTFNPKPEEYYVVANAILYSRLCFDQQVPNHNVLDAARISVDQDGRYNIELALSRWERALFPLELSTLRLTTHSNGYPISCTAE